MNVKCCEAKWDACRDNYNLKYLIQSIMNPYTFATPDADYAQQAFDVGALLLIKTVRF